LASGVVVVMRLFSLAGREADRPLAGFNPSVGSVVAVFASEVPGGASCLAFGVVVGKRLFSLARSEADGPLAGFGSSVGPVVAVFVSLSGGSTGLFVSKDENGVFGEGLEVFHMRLGLASREVVPEEEVTSFVVTPSFWDGEGIDAKPGMVGKVAGALVRLNMTVR